MSYHKAIRMLQWMACSFRTLKLYELQDGIVIHPGNLVLNEDTKIDNAEFLDLCKPMIEETRRKKVDFVHYSAKEQVILILTRFLNATNPSKDLYSISKVALF